MFDELKKLGDESKAIRARIQKQAEESVKPQLRDAFKELKALVPCLKAFKWTQYTPYFNDGDSCTFNVHNLYFKVEGGDEDAGDYEDGFDYPSSYRDKPMKGTSKEESNHLTAFQKLFGALDDDLLEAAFGDHAEITVTSRGISVEEHEHD